MSSESTTLISLKKAVERVDHRLHDLEAQFTELDFLKDNLIEKFERHGRSLATQAAQDELWTAALTLRFTPMELNIVHSYVVEALICLHTRVLQKLPDLVRGLPTLASVLRRKVKNARVRAGWESALEESGLGREDSTALCTFFIAYGDKAEYCTAKVRQMHIRDVTLLITNMVKNQALRNALLKAVQLTEEGRAERAPQSNSRL
ncbi:single-pass membrane and coiled-coil domain-containing protein 1 [Erinaceus europaeus]|uniref:Single-pass membrane and coiled-coil domain-containing protein 1 n=1 Tax=Erinaceus europaeus TaxID=9365 RepID=A0A1S3AN65_ERIEU|nr:single-pass membrane and coiled-coil domain-containing protein 1 [Erinaceus europaeus]